MAVDLKLLGNVFGWVGSAISIYFFISPGVPFYKLVKGQIKLSDSPGLLLIFSFLNCILWFVYGLLLDRPQMFSTNGAGCGITLIFITIYLIFLTKLKYYFTILALILLVAIMGVISYLFYFVIYYKVAGIAANVFNVLMYAATGEKIYRVIKTKDYKLMPIYSIIGAFLSSTSWFIYGLFDFEINVLIPNALGILFSVIQLFVYFWIYCKVKKQEHIIQNDANENLAN